MSSEECELEKCANNRHQADDITPTTPTSTSAAVVNLSSADELVMADSGFNGQQYNFSQEVNQQISPSGEPMCVYLNPVDVTQLYKVNDDGANNPLYLYYPAGQQPEVSATANVVQLNGENSFNPDNIVEIIGEVRGLETFGTLGHPSLMIPAFPAITTAPVIPNSAAMPAVPNSSAMPSAPTSSVMPEAPTSSVIPAAPTSSVTHEVPTSSLEPAVPKSSVEPSVSKSSSKSAVSKSSSKPAAPKLSSKPAVPNIPKSSVKTVVPKSSLKPSVLKSFVRPLAPLAPKSPIEPPVPNSSALPAVQNSSATPGNTNSIGRKRRTGPFEQLCLTKAKVIHIIPQPKYLIKSGGLRCPISNCTYVVPKRGTISCHLLQHVGEPDHSGVIVDQDEFESIRSNRIQILCKYSQRTPFHFKYNCPDHSCRYKLGNGKYFDKFKFLKQHYLKVHAKRKYQCSKCSMTFATHALWNAHERSCGLIFTCDTCQAKYKSLPALQTHVRRCNHACDIAAYKHLIEVFSQGAGPLLLPKPNENIMEVLNIPAQSTSTQVSVVQEGSGATMSQNCDQSQQELDTTSDTEVSEEMDSEVEFVDLVSGDEEETDSCPTKQPAAHNLQLNGKDEPTKTNTQMLTETASPSTSKGLVVWENQSPQINEPSTSRKARQNGLIPILPKPVIQDTRKIEPKKSAQQAVTATRVRNQKRRFSASTQTNDLMKKMSSRVSIQTQTYHASRKRRRRSSKALASAQTQTGVIVNGCIDLVIPFVSSCTDTEYGFNGKQTSLKRQSITEEVNSTPHNENLVNTEMGLSTPTTMSSAQATQFDAASEGPIKQRNVSEIGLSSTLFNHMRGSPIHFSEEYLFPDLLESTSETQTESFLYCPELEEVDSLLSFSNSETQTLFEQETMDENLGNIPNSEPDVFFGFVETKDRETQTNTWQAS